MKDNPKTRSPADIFDFVEQRIQESFKVRIATETNDARNRNSELLKLINMIKARKPNSKVKDSTTQEILNTEMEDVFHITERNIEARQKAFDACKDGFYYKRSPTSYQIPFFDNQIVNKYKCEGRLKCGNSECEVFKRTSNLNYIPYSKKGKSKCYHCNNENLIRDQCSAAKWIIHSEQSRFVVVYYQIGHSCGDPEFVLNEEVIEELGKLFENNSNLSGANAYKTLFEKKLQVINKCEKPEIRKEHINDLLAVVKACTQDHVAKNLKKKTNLSKYPRGVGLKAVKYLQDTMDQNYDQFGIVLITMFDSYVCMVCKAFEYSTSEDELQLSQCKQCNKEMHNTGPHVFLTSREQMKTAIMMTESDGIFSKTTCFMDHQPGRALDFSTFNVAMYDHTLRCIVGLYMAHTPTEDMFSVFLCHATFDMVIKKYMGDDKHFSPYGFNSDNAGAIFRATELWFGVKPHRSCRFHYINSCYMHCANSIGSDREKIIYLRFCFALADSPTAVQFERISESFWAWILETKSREKQLGKPPKL